MYEAVRARKSTLKDIVSWIMQLRGVYFLTQVVDYPIFFELKI